MKRFVAWLSLLAAGCEDNGEDHCVVAIGCSSGGMVVLTLVDRSQLEGGSAQLCRNDVCVSGPFTEIPTGPYGYPLFPQNGDLHGAQLELGMTTDGVFQIDARFSGELDHGPYQDGDVYTLSAFAQEMTVLATRTWVATYERYDLDGYGCRTCIRATLVLE